MAVWPSRIKAGASPGFATPIASSESSPDMVKQSCSSRRPISPICKPACSRAFLTAQFRLLSRSVGVRRMLRDVAFSFAYADNLHDIFRREAGIPTLLARKEWQGRGAIGHFRAVEIVQMWHKVFGVGRVSSPIRIAIGMLCDTLALWGLRALRMASSSTGPSPSGRPHSVAF